MDNVCAILAVNFEYLIKIVLQEFHINWVVERHKALTIVVNIIYPELDVGIVEVNLRVYDVTHNLNCALMSLLQCRIFLSDDYVEEVSSTLVPD